jgi:hypothetical protein
MPLSDDMPRFQWKVLRVNLNDLNLPDQLEALLNEGWQLMDYIDSRECACLLILRKVEFSE